MRKVLIFSLILAFSFPTLAPAQTFSAEQEATLESLKQQLIVLLTQQIALLQAQIQTILAEQARTTQTLGAMTTAVVAPATPQAPSVSYGPVTCEITRELFGNVNNTGTDGYADVYNIRVLATLGNANRLLEHSEVNLPNHTHKDRTSTSTQSFTFSLGNFSGTQEFVVPTCQ